MNSMELHLLECIGGWLVVYSPTCGWVSPVSIPASITGCVWMVPGWLEDAG
jgi:hypothetical protein